MSKILILGAGVAGCSAAYLLTQAGYDVTVLEHLTDPGGGVRTRWYGGHPFTFGPRVFFSKDDEVISHLTKLIKIRHFYTRTWTYVADDGQLYHYPICKADLPKMPDWDVIRRQLAERNEKIPRTDNFENYWLDAIGPNLYYKFVDRYSRKMWGIESNKALTADFEWVNRGTPIRDADTRLYGDQFQGYPEDNDGYNGYFDRCLAGSTAVFQCKVMSFDPQSRIVHTSKGDFSGDIIVNTIHSDALFGFAFGKLQFSGRRLLKVVLPMECVFPDDVTWIHYSGDETYTRITEFKKITCHKSPDTLIEIEMPTLENRYYPVQTDVELKRFEKYRSLFPDRFFSIGRMGSFRYKGIPDAIRDALDVAKAIGPCPL
jgi:UDP-galactopyranose mutase